MPRTIKCCQDQHNTVEQLLNENVYVSQIEEYIKSQTKSFLSYIGQNQAKITLNVIYDEHRKTVADGRYSQIEFEQIISFWFFEDLQQKIKDALVALRKQVKEDVCVRDICREKSLLGVDLEEYDGCNFQETQIMIELNPKDE